MCTNFGCLQSWRYCNSCPEVFSRTGSARIWRKWAGYCHLAALAGVMTLDMAVVCDLVRRSICPGSVTLSTLGCGGSTVCGTLNLVRRATGSYCSLVDVIFGANGTELFVWMNTLGSKSWGWTVAVQSIGCSTECRRV